MSCPRCGADNLCQMASSSKSDVGATAANSGCRANASCWCFQQVLKPAQLAILPKSSSCYCKTCLEELVRDIGGTAPQN